MIISFNSKKPLFMAIFSLLIGGSISVASAQETNESKESKSVNESSKESKSSKVFEEIIVTARRKEENLQDVPVSMSVISEADIIRQNIVTAADLANQVPSLTVNERFGSDNTSFTIRGFTQDLRTTSSVGVFFADVVAQRAGVNGVTAGDGAGPGDMFDLENIQVLKGPQGTLFGRNTTGGAVILQPKRPTDEFEGYIETSIGDYDMTRVQGVVNFPISDSLSLRLGIDDQQRDGYLDNESGIGPQKHGSTNYTAGRIGLLANISDTVENYTVITFTDSDSRPSIAQLFACNPAATLGGECQAQLNRESNDFYAVSQQVVDPKSDIDSWRVINHTEWEISDNFSVKNIIAYGELETRLRSALQGADFRVPSSLPLPSAGKRFTLVGSNGITGIPSTDQKNLVEELQFKGTALDGRLDWQSGLYYERSSPNGIAGQMTDSYLVCSDNAFSSLNPVTWSCQRGLSNLGQLQLGKVWMESKAIYLQGSYEINDEWSATVGVRQTRDETTTEFINRSYTFPTGSLGAPVSVKCVITYATLATGCFQKLDQDSDAPTWVVGAEYAGIDNTMLYAKYSRGYRQGSINAFGAEGFQIYDPEEIDAYELGAKITFDNYISGYLNVAVFYNELTDQQMQIGLLCTLGAASCLANNGAAVVNVAEAESEGIEIDSAFHLTDRLTVKLAYTYIDSEIKEFEIPDLTGTFFNVAIPLATEGEKLPLSPRNQYVVSANYLVPAPDEMGELSVGATYVYQDEQQTSSPSRSPYGIIPSYEIVNFNLDWKRIYGSNVDLGAFVTNALAEEYATHVPGNWATFGAEFRSIGLPRMYGVRLKYSF